MALVVKDRVKVTTTTTGTGALTLGSASSGFQDFSVIGDGNQTYYAITGLGEWEVGIGTYSSISGTLSRDVILESSNAGAAVDLSAGDKEVFVTYPAEKAVTTDDIGTSIQAFDATILKSADIGVTVQGFDANTVKTDANQTLTNKTIAFGSNTLTDVAGTTATQTLTNKTIDGNSNTLTNVSRIFTSSVVTGDWSRVNTSSPWIATKTVTGILSTDVPIVDLNLSGVAFGNVEDVQTDWALVYRVEASGSNEVKLYAIDQPTQTLPIQLKVVR